MQCHISIYVSGEVGTDVKNDIFLHMMDTVGSFRALDLHNDENHDHVRKLVYGLTDCLNYELFTEPIKDSYLKVVHNRSDNHT